MKYPVFIKKNDKIAFVAPSYGCTFEPYLTRVNTSKEVFNNLGYKVEMGPNVFHEIIGRSNTPKKCGDEINKYFNDEDTKAVLAVGGGELMIEILPHIDFTLLSNHPKWYMGYSDNTNLTYLLTTICDVASIYGPCAPSFGITPWHPYLDDSYKLLTGEKLIVGSYGMWQKDDNKTTDPLGQMNLTEQLKMKSYPTNEINFNGRLLGGCLDVLLNFLGTEFDKTKAFIEKYKNDGIVWFLEACDLNTMAIRRGIYQLDKAGWFKYTKGFIFGRPLNGMNPCGGLDEYKAVKDVLKKYKVPMIFDVDLGHLPPSMPLITGSMAKVNLKENKLEIEMELI